MKCRIIIDEHREEEVIVYAHEKTTLVQDIARLVADEDVGLIGYRDKEAIPLTPSEVICFVVEEGKVYAVTDFSHTGGQVLLAIVSTYLLAFVQAGASVFNSIEHWPLAKALLCHFATLYAAYTLCYLGNTWIPFEPAVLLIFTAIFVGGYFLVWGIVLLCVKAVSRKMNQKLG